MEPHPEKATLEVALRFLDSLSNSRALTERAMHAFPETIDRAMGLVAAALGTDASQRFATVAPRTAPPSVRPQRREKIEFPPADDEDLFQ